MAFTAGAMTAMPRIVSIQHHGTNVVVAVDVPAGVEQVVLESCQRNDLRAWMPRAVKPVSAAGEITFVVPAAAAAEIEMFRVRVDEQPPLPSAFYAGQSEFEGELLDSGPVRLWLPVPGGVFLLNTVFLTSFASSADTAGTAILPDAAAGNSAAGDSLRAVEESDIWRARGNRIYFFNANRGLQIIDVTDPDAPALRGTLSLPAAGEQMYLLDDNHVILLLNNRCDGGASSFVALVDVTRDRPRVIARFPLNGSTLETRLVGSALYVATRTWEPVEDSSGAWEQGVDVSAFDFAQPDAPVARPGHHVRGFGGVVTATDSHLFVTTSDTDRPWWTHTLHVFNIADPGGMVRPVTKIPLSGNVKDKFKIHQRGDIVAVVTEGYSSSGVGLRSELATYRLLPAGGDEPRWTRLGSVELGHNESLFATRFDGDRVYVVTYRRVDPLWVVDFSDPTAPQIKGELLIPGWSTYIHPMGDRLLTVGVDDTAGNRVAVQLFDVANPAQPALLSKVVLGEGWSSSEALDNEKAFGVFPDAGLVLLPVSMWRSNQQVQVVQFVDLGHDSLQARGTFENAQAISRRTLLHGNRVLAISSRELLTIDARDRDNPTLRNTLELGYPVDRVVPIGDWLVEFWGTEIRVSAASKPGIAVKQYALEDLPVLGATANGRKIHVLQGRAAPFFGVLDSTGSLINPGTLRHVIFDAGHLPELTVAGADNIETTDTSWLQDAKPLWPKPGLLVWSVNSQQQNWWWNPWPIIGPFVGAPIITMPVLTVEPVLLLPRPIFGVPTMQLASFAPFQPPVSQTVLIAVDVSHARSPRFLSETPLVRNASSVSDTFAADGLVFQSHSTHEWQIISNIFNVATNIVSTPVVVTNATPFYRNWNRHWLDVVDYQQDPTLPVLRSPASLPGSLQGISHHGDILYTVATDFHEQSGLRQTTLSALAYDGVLAHLVDRLSLSTNANEESAQVAVDPRGTVVVARNRGNAGHPRRLECWHLNGQGHFKLLGSLDRPTHSDSLRLLDDLAVLHTEAGFELVDIRQPKSPVALPVNESAGDIPTEINRVSGNRHTGVWLPAGEQGALPLWRP